jgi:SAM-dependent methyltransferase
MEFDDWAPPVIDVDRPSSSRVYDYYLGGAYNFAVDRRVAEQTIAVCHETPLIAQANRAFLRRAVRFLLNAGVRQFLDIGSGIPTMGHVHEIAQAAAPESRVVYVDIDPVAVAHSRDILAGNDRAAVVHEDIRRPDAILGAPEVARLIDLRRPVGVLAVAVLHHISDADDPTGLMARLTAPLVPGSYLVISHGTEEGAQTMTRVAAVYRRAGIELTLRNRRQIEALFGTFELVAPGVVWVADWHPDTVGDGSPDRPELSVNYGGAARKP